MTILTIQDSRFDGTVIAETLMALGHLQPQHFTNPGADYWGEEGCNLGDAAFVHFTCGDYSRHYQQVVMDNHGDWDDDHWNAFLDGFETEAKRIAFERSWQVDQ